MSHNNPEVPEDELYKVKKSSYKNLTALGGGSSLLSCTCAIVPIVLIAVSSSIAAFAASVLGSFDLFFIILGISVFIGMLALDLKRKKSLNISGIRNLIAPITLSAMIFVVITTVLLFVIAPAFLGELQQMHH